MAEVRCMMCGKPNPAEAEVCEHCQARLKPMEASPPESASPSESSREDWLDSLRRDSGELPDLDWEDESEDEEWLDSADISLPGEAENGGDKLPQGRETPATGELPTTPEVSSESLDEGEQETEPEWLRRVRTRQQSEQPDNSGKSADGGPEAAPVSAPNEKVPTESKTTPSGLPEWLSEFEDKTPVADEGGDLPDWLQVEPTGEQATPVDQEQPQDEIPEWLSEFGEVNKDHAEGAGAVPSAAVAPFTDEADDAGMGVPEDLEVVYLDLPDEPLAEGDPEKIAGVANASSPEADTDKGAQDGDIPDWLSDLEGSAPVIEGVDLASIEDEPEIDLDWVEGKTAGDEAMARVKDEEGVHDDLEFPEEIAPFIGDVPELLDDDLVLPDTFEEPPEPSPDDIEQADLPVWLESMRPIGAATAASLVDSDPDTEVESSGPLAGLQGVLPAEPEIARIKQAAAFSIKLNVTEKQQAHVAALNELVRGEAEAKPLLKRKVITSQNILRLVILIVLVVVIGWAVYTGSQSQPVPGFSQGIFDTNTLINQLPEQAAVLLAVDYEPGLAGEMEAVSSAVIDHLMIKGAYLALMSTSPTGPAQAERLINAINSRGDHQYTGIEHYTNLGYIPGGATALSAFANSPRQVIPFSTDGLMMWESGPLGSIHQLENFAMVVVATEDADKARAWIEQVQPYLGTTPMIMLLSAQAEPLILPFYEGGSQQLQGLVAGLSGGASYEQFINRPGPGRQYWDSFSLASITAVLLILLGGIINLISDRLTPPKIFRSKSRS